MTRIFFTCLLMAFSTITYAQGIQFFEGNWSQLLQTAKQQNKMIFVDVYTDWCAPCKLMSKTVFTAKSVGDKYNSAFLNYKLNAEKGEGIQLANQFNVDSYPTLLFFNSRGDLLHRFSGSMEPAGLNATADKVIAINTDTMTIGALEAAFKQGKRDPAFMRSFIVRLKKLNLDNNKVMDVYFTSLSWQELSEESTVTFLASNIRSIHTPVLAFVMERYNKLSKPVKLELTSPLFALLTDQGAYDAFKNNRMGELKQLLSWADMLEGISGKQHWHKDRIRIVYARAIRDAALVKETGYRVVKGLPEISMDSVNREDARRFAQFMEPYLKGEKDSTLSADAWKEELPLLKKQYTMEIAYKLYFVANEFDALPDGEKKALQDALVWARKAKAMEPGRKAYVALVEKLEKRVGKL